MRKVHYKVVLDIFIHEDEDVDVRDALLGAYFQPEVDGEGDMFMFDIIDVSVETVEVTDSR